MTSTPTSWGLLKQPYKQEPTREDLSAGISPNSFLIRELHNRRPWIILSLSLLLRSRRARKTLFGEWAKDSFD